MRPPLTPSSTCRANVVTVWIMVVTDGYGLSGSSFWTEAQHCSRDGCHTEGRKLLDGLKDPIRRKTILRCVLTEP